MQVPEAEEAAESPTMSQERGVTFRRSGRFTRRPRRIRRFGGRRRPLRRTALLCSHSFQE